MTEQKTQPEQIGILGGAFDPIHNGHLALAAAAEATGLNQVIFLPAAVSPFKPKGALASASDRCEMIRLALADHPNWSLSQLELDRGGISYTIDTLRALRTRLGSQSQLHLIIGMDNFVEIGAWHQVERLVGLVGLIVAARPGVDPAEAAGSNRYWMDQFQALGRVKMISLAEGASSREVRERIRSGGELNSLLPLAVANYIRRQGLYRDDH